MERRIEAYAVAGQIAWLVIDPVRQVDDNGLLSHTGQYVCYFNHKEPNAVVLGELLRDEEGRVRVFGSIDEGAQACKDRIDAALRT